MAARSVLMIGWEYPPAMTGGLAVACQGLARALARRGTSIQFLIPMAPGGAAGHDDRGVRVFSPVGRGLDRSGAVQLRESLLRADPASRNAAGLRASSPDAIPTGALPPDGAYATPQPDPGSAAANDLLARLAPGETGAALALSLEEFLSSDAPLLHGGYGAGLLQEVERLALLAPLLVQNLSFNIIHAHDWMSFPAGLAVARASGRPLVCHIHATEFDRSGHAPNEFVRQIEARALAEADQIVTVSNYTKSILVEHYGAAPDRIAPVHNAVEFELESAAPQSARGVRDPVVLFLGRITFQKGPEYFVRAARQVIQELGAVRFVMAGAGDMYARMIELAAEMGLGRYFHYTGFLNREEVRRMYAASDLYVMPSVSEPFGISPLEAMLHGVPVIVSKQSGVSEVVENAVKVDFWDVDEMARSIVRLLRSSQAERQGLRESSRAEAGQVTWERSAEALERIYDRMLAP